MRLIGVVGTAGVVVGTAGVVVVVAAVLEVAWDVAVAFAPLKGLLVEPKSVDGVSILPARRSNLSQRHETNYHNHISTFSEAYP